MSRVHPDEKPAIAERLMRLPDTIKPKRASGKRKFLVTDNGLFCDLATTLARDPKTEWVGYFMPWASAFSQRNQLKVGEGLEGVERVEHWEDEKYVDDPDIIWVFPDLHYPERQLMLQDMGRRVWGSRRGEQLELYRKRAKKAMAKAGLSIGPFEVVKGIADLRDYIKGHKDVWVKSSLTRGDFESFQAENYRLIEPLLDQIEHRLGLDADDAEFIVEKDIPNAVELAADIYCIDGDFPKSGVVGVERKAKGYVGRFMPASQWPKQVLDINRILAPMLKRFMYRNLLSIEARITKDGTPWILDPACRFGSPPSELLILMYSNIADIIAEGADGKLVEPVPAGKWGAELMIYSSWAEKNWQPIDFPAKLRPNIALRYVSYQKGGYAVRPQPSELSHIGSVSAVGATMEEAIETCKEYAKQIKGYAIETYPTALDDIRDTWKTLPQYKVRL